MGLLISIFLQVEAHIIQLLFPNRILPPQNINENKQINEENIYKEDLKTALSIDSFSEGKFNGKYQELRYKDIIYKEIT